MLCRLGAKQDVFNAQVYFLFRVVTRAYTVISVFPTMPVGVCVWEQGLCLCKVGNDNNGLLHITFEHVSVPETSPDVTVLLRVVRAATLLTNKTRIVVVPHPGPATYPRGKLNEMLIRVLQAHLPNASVLPTSHKERLDACCAATGRDIEEEALQLVTDGGVGSRSEATTFGTPLHVEVWKQQKQLMVQEADKLLQDTKKCANAPEAYASYLHVNSQPGAFEYAAEALWNALSVEDPPSSGSKRRQQQQSQQRSKRSCTCSLPSYLADLEAIQFYEPDWVGADYYEPDFDEVDDEDLADWDKEAELQAIWAYGEEGYEPDDDDVDDGYWGYGAIAAHAEGDVEWDKGSEGRSEFEDGSDASDADKGSQPAEKASAVKALAVNVKGSEEQQKSPKSQRPKALRSSWAQAAGGGAVAVLPCSRAAAAAAAAVAAAHK